jgi:hypothetical protein
MAELQHEWWPGTDSAFGIPVQEFYRVQDEQEKAMQSLVSLPEGERSIAVRDRVVEILAMTEAWRGVRADAPWQPQSPRETADERWASWLMMNDPIFRSTVDHVSYFISALLRRRA